MDIKLNEEVLDVSSFLLVEESADSEADFMTWEMCLDAPATADDEDDAESCSCDASHQVLDYDDVDDQNLSDCDDDGVIDNDDDDDHGELRWGSSRRCKLWLGYMSTEEGEQEESSRVGFTRKLKNDEMEDRVFWETCMAVGYP